jgi:hypothetical protein
MLISHSVAWTKVADELSRVVPQEQSRMTFNDMCVEVFDHLEVRGVLWTSWVVCVSALYAANTHVAKWTYISCLVFMSIVERPSRCFQCFRFLPC